MTSSDATRSLRIAKRGSTSESGLPKSVSQQRNLQALRPSSQNAGHLFLGVEEIGEPTPVSRETVVCASTPMERRKREPKRAMKLLSFIADFLCCLGSVNKKDVVR